MNENISNSGLWKDENVLEFAKVLVKCEKTISPQKREDLSSTIKKLEDPNKRNAPGKIKALMDLLKAQFEVAYGAAA